MTDLEKLAHLLEHWREHNDEHAVNYRTWADKAEAAGRSEAARLLREAAEATTQVNGLFTRARAALE
ncbi:MAG: hypothetical protein AB1896_10530 [Thermodesulfobacteriota bacterium]